MFDSIILITGEVEQSFLGNRLRRHNPALAVHPVVTGADLARLDRALLPASRLVAFATDVLVPAEAIAATGWGAYNFHPGPPAYPGWAPAAFAVYRGETRFGATAHVMTERIDGGAIVAVDMFDVPAGAAAPHLEELAYAALARLFWRLAEDLATRATPLPILDIAWGNERCTRRAFAELCDIPPDIDAGELERRVRAFGGGDGIPRPTVTLHGHRFRLD